MDYPFTRKSRYNASNNWWFLPFDLFKTEQEKENSAKTLRNSPILSYLDEISRKDKFKYLLILLVVILLFYRLNLHWTIWIGLFIGLMITYYLNEKNAQELNNSADQIWTVIKGPLLKNTKYFITDPQFVQFINNVSEFKKYNILEFNRFIVTLDKFLKLMYNMKIGVDRCKENIDLLQDFKTNSLNQFHSLIYNIHNADLREKANHYSKELGYLLNDRMRYLLKICKQYYTLKPADIESRFDITGIDDPMPMDHMYDSHYNFYN
jgi:hypothetical protein